ncbi:hypothetical protein Q7P37_007245 [Cladosporium fusiforme]
MASTRPPSGRFDPAIPAVVQMPPLPSPPACIHGVIDRLKKTPTRTRTTRSNTDSSSSSTHCTQTSSTGSRQHPSSDISAPLSTSTDATSLPPPSTISPDNPSLSRAITTLLRNPDNIPLNTILPLNLSECKIEVHVHVHSKERPSFPPLRNHPEQLKRKRDSSEEGGTSDASEASERHAKKMKFSHEGGFGRVGRGRRMGQRERNRAKNRENAVAADVRRRSMRNARNAGVEVWRR